MWCLAIVRDRPVSPVARISTTRQIQLLHGADDAVIAEFCDDQVIAGRGADGGTAEQRWREWELELVGDGAERRADGPGMRPTAGRRCQTGRPRLQAGARARYVAGRPTGRPAASGNGRTDRRTAGIRPRGARGGRRRGPPDAGGGPQDPQPAAGVAAFVRTRRRRAGHRRTARAGQCAGGRPRRRGTGRPLPPRSRRRAAGAWSVDPFGNVWSAAPSSATALDSDMRWPLCAYRATSVCSTRWTQRSPRPRPPTARLRRRPWSRPVRRSARRRKPRGTLATQPIATTESTESVSAPNVFATPPMPSARKRYPGAPKSCSRCSAIIRTAWSAASI